MTSACEEIHVAPILQLLLRKAWAADELRRAPETMSEGCSPSLQSGTPRVQSLLS